MHHILELGFVVSAKGYSAFGLSIQSELELPELFTAEPNPSPDVTIGIGPVEPKTEDPGLHLNGETLVLVVPDVARFRIASGTTITVDPQPGAPERNIRLFLLGSAFGALLLQRGLLPLHANAVEVGGKAVAFMGPSGAGKSTLAAWFHDQGHPVLADDVCVVRIDPSGLPTAYPGLPRLRLWLDAIERMGKAGGYERSYIDPLERLDKFDVPIGPTECALKSRPLAALYCLDRAA